MKAGATARDAVILGLAGVEASAMLAAGAVRHAGWWIDWHTRPGTGTRQRDDADARARRAAAMRLMRAA